MKLSNKEFCEKYLVSRRKTDSLKWDALDVRFGDPNLIAMWVADMEFKTSEKVIEKLVERVQQGVYGYTIIGDDYYDAVIKWHKDRHKYELKKEWFRFSNGVVTAIYWLINAFTKVDDSVIIFTPVYYPFHNAIKDNNRKLVRSELVRGEGARYFIDFEDFERKIVENDVKMFIQCSPHNPVSRVWSEDELRKVLEICEKHNVLVITDEIHQDIIPSEHEFIAAARIDDGKYLDNMIILNSASKTFNLACLLSSHIFIPNEDIRKQYDAYAKTVNQIEPNVLGLTATKAAYTYGADWADSLVSVIKSNFEYFRDALVQSHPKLIVTPLEGTYLCWVDFREYVKPEDIKEFIQGDCNIASDYGQWFSDQCAGFLRFNLATDPELVKETAKLIIEGLNKRV